jgi:hypothetical protein
MGALFSKSYNAIREFESVNSVKKSFVVLSVAMPDGTRRPTRPAGETIECASSAKTA